MPMVFNLVAALLIAVAALIGRGGVKGLVADEARMAECCEARTVGSSET